MALRIHESEPVSSGTFDARMRVPGGWIYTKHSAGWAVFVPDPPDPAAVARAVVSEISTLAADLIENTRGWRAEMPQKERDMFDRLHLALISLGANADDRTEGAL